MKFLLTELFAVIGLSTVLLSAESNSTKIEVKKEVVDYQQKLDELLQKTAIDLKNNTIDNNITIARDYNAVGYYYNKTGKTDLALEYYLKATNIAEDQKKPHLKLKTIYYNNVATAYEQLKKFPLALKYYNKALIIYKDTLPQGHPYIAGTSYDIANIYEQMGDMDKALKYHQDALNIRIASLRPLNHPDTIASYDKVLQLYTEKKEYDQVLKYGKQLLDLVNGDIKIDLQKKLDDIVKIQQKIKIKK